jgi:DNA-binding transcriptional regulator YdaS (Cro superfamily)
MNLSQYLVQERGRQSSLAKAIGAHAPDISRWANGTRPIPLEYGAEIERATGGQVTRKEMFPTRWMSIWPELVVETHTRRKDDLPLDNTVDEISQTSAQAIGKIAAAEPSS